jgi:hypothetical protein
MQPNVLSPSGCGHTIYGGLISRDFRSTFSFGLSMIPFAFWWFATTRGILPPGFGAAELGDRLNAVTQWGGYEPGETDLTNLSRKASSITGCAWQSTVSPAK